MQKKSEKRTIIALLSLCTALLILWRAMPQSAPPAVKWRTYTVAAQEKAHQQGKPVIVFFSAPW
ncbi:MAG: thioredoxin family protein [Abditibacteriales bacterium]|nr:thioredoxin family protein [Abditibacteriales bacterium]MDW8366841.1 hypothetical protein [Abditibacteriales bacterium]